MPIIQQKQRKKERKKRCCKANKAKLNKINIICGIFFLKTSHQVRERDLNLFKM